MTGIAAEIRVEQEGSDPRRGTIRAGGMVAPCALGRTGITATKREGDGATPAGRHRLVSVFYRPDRVRRPVTCLPVFAIRPDSGWCDDPADPRYNRLIRRPYPASHERLWLRDRLYDLMAVLDYNYARPLSGWGSAIFLHLASPGFGPTAGCVAVVPEVMRRLLTFADTETRIVIR